MTLDIVILSYYWPPAGGSGVQRWMYFAKYLKDFGHNITVISVNPDKASYKSLNETFAEMTKDINVITTNTIEPLKLYSLLKSGSTTKGIPLGHVGQDDSSLFGKVSNWVRANLFIPDARIGWNRFAYKALNAHLEENKPDFVISTGPPHSTHLIGLMMKKKFPDQKWIVDFRDPWKEIFYEDSNPRTTRSKNKNETLEIEVIRNCDHLITIGPGLQKLLINKEIKKSTDISYVFNGYDADKMKAIQRTEKSVFTLSFIGTVVDDKMTFDPIIAAIHYITEKYNAKVSIEMAGTITKKTIDLFSNIQNVEFINHGYVSHEFAIQLMKSSHIVFTSLAVNEHDNLIISGKLMEYLSSRTPTLVIGNIHGDAATVMSDIQYASVISQSDTIGAEMFCDGIYKEFSHGNILRNNTASIEMFSREHTSKKLEELLISINE